MFMRPRAFVKYHRTVLTGIGIFALAALTAVTSLFTATATANSPRFNFLSNDYPTLQVFNPAINNYSTSTNAAVGSQVEMYVWVHNGVPGTTAQNTRARVVLPSTTSATHSATGTVWASNADAVSSSVTVSVGSESRLSYVPGSARLLKNINNTMTEVSWGSGVNPDDIITANGVALGGVDGCWQYAQAVSILVNVEGTNPNLFVQKEVARAGGDTYSQAITAQPNDAVEYMIFLENRGNGTAINPTITDVLNARTKYLPNSSMVRTKVDNQDVDTVIPDSQIQITTLSDGRQQLRYSFPNMAARPDAALYLIFQVTVAQKDQFPIGTTVIPNVAVADAVNTAEKTSNQVTVTVTRAQDPVISFDIVKQGRNDSKGDTVWADEIPTAAGSNDVIGFRIMLTNTGNTTAQDVLMKDLLPQGLSLVPGSVKLTNRNVTGQQLPDTLVTTGYTFANLEAGTLNQQIVTFQTKVTRECFGTHNLINTAQVVYQNVVRDQDTASVIFSCTAGLTITKDARTGSNAFADNAGIVREGQVLTYRIRVANTGSSTITNPVLRDVLPSFVTYKDNSLAIDGQFMSDAVEAAFFAGGITLTNLTPGMVKEVTFQVVVDECPNFGDTQLVNTARVTADGLTERSDTATATLRVLKPTLTGR